MSRPPRIAIACRQVAGVTGTTTGIIEHARRLAGLGWRIDVFGEKLDEARLASAGAWARRLRNIPWGAALKRRVFSWRFDRALAREGYDLVWGHGDTLTQDVLSLHNCVHEAHERVHGLPLPRASSVGRLHARILSERRFKLLIANSVLMRDDVVRRFDVQPEAVRVVHPGHDPARFRPEDRLCGRALRRELGVGSGELLVGLISSGDFVKRGVALFLGGLAGLPPKLKEGLHAVIIGRESRLDHYRRLAAGSGLGERIRFLAPVPDVQRCYHALDVYVHPALFEEFGQSVQEAMACGVCVLAGSRVGAAELLSEDARRMLLDVPGEAGLAAALARLLREPATRRGWAEAGRAAAAVNTWDRNFAATRAVLEELLIPSPRRAV